MAGSSEGIEVSAAMLDAARGAIRFLEPFTRVCEMSNKEIAFIYAAMERARNYPFTPG